MKYRDRILVVDLDGTLIRSDTLFESFWACLSRTWTTPIVALASLSGGRAELKRRLCSMGIIDVALLPYNADVLTYIRKWRDGGGRIVLVTAADQTLADAVAAHLGLFDEAYGSHDGVNLKGETKACFLADRFGDGQFVYIGDAAADLPVWAKSAKAVTVNAKPRLRAKVDALGREAEHLSNQARAIRPYIKALRPHQWLKNMLVFVPMLAAHKLSFELLWQSTLAFIAFNFIASGVYVVNDLIDLAADRAHPRKRLRPLASGDLPIAHGTWLAPLVLLVGVACSAMLGWLFTLVMLGYIASTTAYSLNLKRRVIIDICILAGLYTTRIVAGGVATSIPLSVWLLAFSIFFFFSLAAIKRYAELVYGVASGEVKAHGRGYHVDDLPLVGTMAIASGYVSVLVMALYLNSLTVLELYRTPSALWGICFILLFWISRMAMVTHRGAMHDDPIVYAISDRISRVCLLLVLGLAVAAAVL